MNVAENGNVTCGACGVTGYPCINMDDFGRLAPCCPACGVKHAEMSAPVIQAPPSTEKKVPQRTPPVLSIVRSQPATPAETDPIKLIKNRLAFLDEELAKAADYKAESRRLRRMLKAAGDVK